MKDIFEIKEGSDTIECHYTCDGRIVDEETDYDYIDFKLDKVVVNGVDCTEYALRFKDLKESKDDDERYILDGVLTPECVGVLFAEDYTWSKLEELVHEYLEQTV